MITAARMTTKSMGKYTLKGRIATGGMAEIYLATQRGQNGLERDVVIKRLRPHLEGSPRWRRMFLDEARIGASLSHPNIVHVYDIDEHDGLPYIVMEYIRGEELQQVCRAGVQAGNFLPLAYAVELVVAAARGLAHIHERKGSDDEPLRIVHCDISPTNLLVTEDGLLKIIDFGIARYARRDDSYARSIPGKLSYMSPEQAVRGVVDHRSDIFCLGIVLYEITVGRRLFRGPAKDVAARLQTGTIPSPVSVRDDFPPQLADIVMTALSHEPGERYQSAAALAADLESFRDRCGLRASQGDIAGHLRALGLPRTLEYPGNAASTANRTGASSAPGEEASTWEEVEESREDVAEVLGVDPELLDRADTAPITSSQSTNAGDDTTARPRDAGTSRGVTTDGHDRELSRQRVTLVVLMIIAAIGGVTYAIMQ